MDKQTLRAEMRARRRAYVHGLDAAERAKLLVALADRISEHLPADGYVASYSAVGYEIDPALISVRLGDRLVLPCLESVDAPMSFRKATGTLEDGPLRIPQPAIGATEVEPDTLLVPLVAADLSRNRLGQGKGYYDRTLAALSQRKPIRTIGLAWDIQIVDKLPTDPWDVPLDLVVTPTRILR